MKIVDLEQGSDEWAEFRRGKITGTRLGSIWSTRQYTVSDILTLFEKRGLDKAKLVELTNKKVPTKADLEKLLTEDDKAELASDAEKKLEFYQILADQVATVAGFENKMDRGLELEPEAAMAFASKFDKELVIIGCVEAEADARVINSPDRYIKPARGKIYKEAVEIKCLASAKHLQAFFERRIPDEYFSQKVQYFVTNEKLETLYWVFYDPRIALLPLFTLVVKREDLGHWPETMLKYQLRTLNEIDELTNRLLAESDNIMLTARAEK